MKVFIFLSLIAGAFAFLDEDCPANSHYESCGTACPLTCVNYKNPPEACVLMCKPGCHCDEGYVKTKDGKCVDPDNCPSHPDAICGRNKHYNECGTACPLTCENYENPPKICNLMCKTGCECDKGYVLNAKGNCVEPKHCLAKEKNCHEEADGGMCRGYFPMWYYDTESKSCKEFIYGGCQGNGNRYATKEECSKTCEDVELAYVTCEQEKEVGPCRGAFPRFFYNKHTGKCEQFIYGGCQGNDNNFSSEEDCEAVCIKHLL